MKEETTFDSFFHSNLSLLRDVLNLMTKIILASFTLQESTQKNEACKSPKYNI